MVHVTWPSHAPFRDDCHPPSSTC